MNMDLIFRKYEADDLTALKEIFFSNVPTYFADFEWNDFEGFLKDDIVDNCFYDVVLFNSKIIGAGGIAQNDDKSISLCWGMIDEAYHKKGFGKKLLQHRLKLSQAHFPNQTIVISTTQHTYAFFVKYGFKTTEIKNDFWAKDLHLYKMKN
jgi:[ribosomal protein S18]-alanine N-acetyltransferase